MDCRREDQDTADSVRWSTERTQMEQLPMIPLDVSIEHQKHHVRRLVMKLYQEHMELDIEDAK